MTKKDFLLGFAARIGQLKQELGVFQNSDGLALSANHETGIVMSYLGIASDKLIKLSEKV